MSQETITIIDRSTNQPVEAVLETDLDRVRLVDAEIEWAPERLRALRRLMTHGTPGQPIPQHVHWNWAVKAPGPVARLQVARDRKRGQVSGG